MSPQSKEDIIKRIKTEIPYVDIKPYSHNIIGMLLRILEENYGRDVVIDVVKTTALKDIGWGHLLNAEN